MTQSRGAMLSFGLAVIVSFISRMIRFPLRLVIAGVLAVFFVIFPFQLLSPAFDEGGFAAHVPFQMSDRMTQRYENTFDSGTINESMESGRLWVVKKGLAIWYDHPILGTGFGTFGDSASYALGSPLQKAYQLPRLLYADNQYIEVLVETGIAGVILFAGFIIGLIGFLWERKHALKLRGQLIGLMIGAVLAGCYYSIWEMLPFTFSFFLFLAFYENGQREDEGNPYV
jgi:O-antigen ligase